MRGIGSNKRLINQNWQTGVFGNGIATPSGVADVEKAAVQNLAEHLSGDEV
ncbi:MAG: hypothetical protein SCK70_00150 [bacterium]|nr:hypothetical protein [bacterium]